MELSRVSGNISELMVAAEQDRVIVPDLSGEGMNSGRGVYWLFYRIVYIILEIFYPGIELTNFRNALEKTDSAFKEYLTVLKVNCDRYIEFVKATLVQNGENTPDTDLEALSGLRGAITDWNSHMGHLTSEKMDELIQKVAGVYSQAFENRQKEETFEILIKDGAIKKAGEIQKMIHLESFSTTPVPFSLLQKLAVQKELTAPDKKAVKKWIGDLNQITVTDLDEGLRAFVTILRENEEQPLSLEHLEWGLKDLGCKLFDQVDPQFNRRWEELEGDLRDTLHCNDRELKLGKRIDNTNLDSDLFAVYELIDDVEKRAVQIGKNGAALRIAKINLMKTNQDPIPMANMIEVDSLGHCAIIERLYPISTFFTWNNQEGAIDPEDKANVLIIVKMIKALLKSKRFPKNFSLASLQLNQNKEFKAGKVFEWREFDASADFLPLASILEACAGENKYIFRHLISKTLFRDIDDKLEVEKIVKTEKLHVHPDHEFYKLCITKALENDPITVEKIGSTMKSVRVVKKEPIAQGKKLQEDVKKLKADCLEKVKSYSYDEKRIEKRLNGFIERLYYRNGLSLKSEFPDWVVETTIDCLLEKKWITHKS